MQSKRNTMFGKYNKFNLLLFIFFLFYLNQTQGSDELDGGFLELKILDKVSSKNTTITLKIGEEKKFQNLIFRSQKCRNTKFDDNPEITAYLQVRDLNKKNKDKVFIFNGWTFASSPSVKPFDHPVYDLWLTGCENI